MKQVLGAAADNGQSLWEPRQLDGIPGAVLEFDGRLRALAG